jgi:hypothetical protein
MLNRKGMPPGLKMPCWVHEGPALAIEHEAVRNDIVAQNQIAALHAPDVIECGSANDDVASDQLVSRHRAPQS